MKSSIVNSNQSTPSSKARSKAHPIFAPIRLIVVDPSSGYCKTVWCAIGAGLTNVLIGAVNMAAILYSVVSKDPHVALCTLAYQFFSAEAILSLNYVSGWATPMRLRHRKLAHVLLQICALVCAITGTVLVVIQKEWSGSLHGVTGIVAAMIAGFTALSGPFALFSGRYLKIFHMSIGVPSFAMSSVSLCLAFHMSDFQTWATLVPTCLLTAFVIFYTTFIIIIVLLKCMMKI